MIAGCRRLLRRLGRLPGRLLCQLVGCRVHRVHRAAGLAVCRDCGRSWRTWRVH